MPMTMPQVAAEVRDGNVADCAALLFVASTLTDNELEVLSPGYAVAFLREKQMQGGSYLILAGALFFINPHAPAAGPCTPHSCAPSRHGVWLKLIRIQAQVWGGSLPERNTCHMLARRPLHTRTSLPCALSSPACTLMSPFSQCPLPLLPMHTHAALAADWPSLH